MILDLRGAALAALEKLASELSAISRWCENVGPGTREVRRAPE